MDTRTPGCTLDQPDPLTLAASTWLACGVVLYAFTPLPLRDAALGWSVAFWLLGAPALMLAVRRCMARSRPPRAAARGGRSGPHARQHRPAIRRRRLPHPQQTAPTVDATAAAMPSTGTHAARKEPSRRHIATR